jgi:protein phosphatase
MPDTVLPYLALYSHRLHVPELYGVCAGENDALIPLLANAPLDQAGHLLPTLEGSWATVSPVRQVYWLWQLLQLWQPLLQQGVAASLLIPDNIRVEGWRVRLRELVASAPAQVGADEAASPSVLGSENADATTPALRDLAAIWLPWISRSSAAIQAPLQDLCQSMQADETAGTIAALSDRLNHLLLQQAAQLPLRLEIAGATTTGPQRSHNEDSCYPSQAQPSAAEDSLLPHVGIICDGIGGHEGGEVASQLALRSLQMQLRALFAEFAEQADLLTPAIVEQQLIEVVRVVNNLIASQNDAQKRELRQRMGTTLVMAIQLPQRIGIVAGTQSANTHELYLVHVGDSRAYWLTPNYCHLLTVDDDVAAREVHAGRSPYAVAIRRADAGALTQAIGTRDADTLAVTVQRFIIEENGVLLLCSDGLSDNDRVEQFWERLTTPIFINQLGLDQAVERWIDLANHQNGHDNTSIVMLHCQISEYPPFFEEPTQETPKTADDSTASTSDTSPEDELAESSKALLYDDYGEEPGGVEEPVTTPNLQTPGKAPARFPVVVAGVIALMFVVGAVGVVAWQQIDPIGFQQTWNRLVHPPED